MHHICAPSAPELGAGRPQEALTTAATSPGSTSLPKPNGNSAKSTTGSPGSRLLTSLAVSAVLDHIDSILFFPFAGRARDDVRAGMLTTVFRQRTLVAYAIDESSIWSSTS